MESVGMARPCGTDQATVDIEEVHSLSTPRSLLAALFARDAGVTYRAVAYIRYAGDRPPETLRGTIFGPPRATVRDISPPDAWTPEMAACVFELECQLLANGWTPSDPEVGGLPRHYTRPPAFA